MISFRPGPVASEDFSNVIRRPIKAVLCDVDGTLYYEGPLRYCMRLELCALPFATKSCWKAYSVWRSLGYFRGVREELRSLGEPDGSLSTLQYTEAARQAGQDVAQIERAVTEWIHQRPLKYLRLCRRRGIEAFLTCMERRGVRAGVFSDYPVLDKLQALGLADRMSLALCSTDRGINAFKPHPKGFWHACALWGLSPDEVLYIGDRPEVDAVGAANAGMPSALLGGGARGREHNQISACSVTFSSFRRLQYALTPYC
jgi:phosphoglycolate phosphatase/putative hydrolase of the HAD superfamily